MGKNEIQLQLTFIVDDEGFNRFLEMAHNKCNEPPVGAMIWRRRGQ